MNARVRRCGGAYRFAQRNSSLYAKQGKDRSKANRSFRQVLESKKEKATK